MKAMLQRVASASVTVDNQLISTIGKGVLIFAGVSEKDTHKDVESMASKVLKMKMWPDEAGVNWKKNVQEIGGEVLCVSQFTLMASTKKGNKPDFHGAAAGEKARELYDQFFGKVQELYDPVKVKNGVFQAMMEVDLQNSGPVGVDFKSIDGAVTLEIDTRSTRSTDASAVEDDPAESPLGEASFGSGKPDQTSATSVYEDNPELLQ